MRSGIDGLPTPRRFERLRDARGVRRRAFGQADERPYRRLTADWFRAGAAALLVWLSVRHVGDASAFEHELERLFAGLPDGARGLLEALSRLGSLWAVVLVASAALVARRWRLAGLLLVAGACAWFTARLVAFLVGGAGLVDAVADVFRLSKQPIYPTVPLAVVAGVLFTALPFLTRPMRRSAEVVVWLSALGTLYRAAGSANAVFAGLVIGWGIAAVLHLGCGSPAGRPTMVQVRAALSELGIATTSVQLAEQQRSGFTLVRATRDDGCALDVRVYGRDAGDTQLVSKVWRYVFYKDSGATLTLTRLQQVEHEALCQIVARDAGVHVPRLLAVGVAGPSAAVFVTEHVGGGAVDDEADPAGWLRALWCDVARLRDARVAHGTLDLEHVVVWDGTPMIVDFSLASVSASPQRLDRDVANLLVSSGLVVGAERAVGVAVDAIGVEVVGAAQPFLSKPALSRPTRGALRHDKKLLDGMQAEVARATGVDVVEPVELRRVRPLTVMMLVGLLFALWVILGQVGSISEVIDTLRTADWGWVVVCALLTQMTQVAYAFTTIGSVDERVPLGPAVLMQYAVSFTNMVLPTGAASTLMNIRFLQKQGSSLAVATSSGVLCGLSGTVAQFVLFLLTLLAVGQSGAVGNLGGTEDNDAKLILVAVVVAGAALGVVFVLPQLRAYARERVWPQLRNGVQNLWSVFTTPRKLFLVLAGSLGAPILNTLGLAAALAAYGGHLGLGELLLVVTGAGFISSVVPVPGGIGVAEASLIAGLTAFGVDASIASAAVITYRLFTTYLPPIPGSYATKWLIAHGDL
jgi:uncharacterized membrane protein YbhN (UPF0104 family)/tRNA A-37 threonylcarbamoyl transferase component Bud32